MHSTLGGRVLAAAALALFVSPSLAQTVTPGLVAYDEALLGGRLRSFANTGGDEIYTGVPGLGSLPRAQRNALWATGDNTVTLTLDGVTGDLTTQVDNVNGTYTLVRSAADLATDLAAKGKTLSLDDLNVLHITVADRDAGSSVAFNDVLLDGNALGSFAGTGFNDWTVSDYDFSQGFQLTGVVVLSGPFSNSQELSRVDLQVGVDLPDFASFCDAADGALAACPCANPGAPDTGCDIQQSTGGVGLTVVAQRTTPLNRATLQGAGFPAGTTPTAIVIRAPALDPASPVVFGDGLRCVGVPLVRLGAAFASDGTSTHTFGHSAMAPTGDNYYQLWFRNTPSMYCTPDAFNLSNGRVLTW